MEVTIATHNGSDYCLEHNRREESLVKNEKHIDLNEPHENWIDRDIRKTYEDIFGEARKKYNAKQKRKSKIVEDYYDYIRKDKQRNECNEMIISIGNARNPVPVDLGKEIMKEFVDTWQQRNPNLYLVGAYYHADEVSKNKRTGQAFCLPHVHLNYICVAHNYNRHMETQVSQERAFEEMGYKSSGYNDTAQMKWTKVQNEYLQELCEQRGLTVIHLDEKREHLDNLMYKEYMDRKDEMEHEVEQIKDEKINETNKIINECYKQQIKKMKKDIEQEYDERYEKLDDLVRENYRASHSGNFLDNQIKRAEEQLEIEELRELKNFCEEWCYKDITLYQMFKDDQREKQKKKRKRHERNDDYYER